MRFLAPFNESHTVPVEHIVAAGDARNGSFEYAQKFAVDLVVLGSPESELTEEDFHTSTVLQVDSNSQVPGPLPDPAGRYFRRRVEDRGRAH